ncbi:MAG: SgcJ/EcaC family oxidoreductase [Verrucomicrobia bacterium]|nr:SgcJ/EcaC family oxidoreductase [Verrucomicrobiota bacterium]
MGLRLKASIFLILVSLLALATSIAADPKSDLDTINQEKVAGAADPEKEIYNQLMRMADAWNRHDIDAYLDGFLHSDDLVVVVEGETVRGWDLLSKAYHAGYPNPQEMGTLTIDRVQVQMLSPDLGFVLGSYTVSFPKKKSFGTDTIIMKKVSEGWREVISHTSFVEP